ncbi:hypothetical protein, partial [Micromonospora sp. KC207]|uniref:hypothetical protein n=1 Tax=Micromonospora sp. KC207 TaxID=2530377 RepID=UPI001A9E3B19
MPFVYLAQYRHARQLFTVPFDTLRRLGEEVPDTGGHPAVPGPAVDGPGRRLCGTRTTRRPAPSSPNTRPSPRPTSPCPT